MTTVLVTGGGGYIGCRLVPALLAAGHTVRVLDRFFFGTDPLLMVVSPREVEIFEADIRDEGTLTRALEGCHQVVHLAAFSNDPSADLDEHETLAVNRDAVLTLHHLSVQAGVQRLVNASSASVYGARQEARVIESTPCNPVSLYGQLKLETDRFLAGASSATTATVSLRSATVAGYSPRMRLDLTANIFAAQGFFRGVISVHGGRQQRPMVHIDDLVDAYLWALATPAKAVSGKAFNVGSETYAVLEIAEIVREVLQERGVGALVEQSEILDTRSYRLNSDTIEAAGCAPTRGLRRAVADVVDAFAAGAVLDPDAPRYRNVATLTAEGFGR